MPAANELILLFVVVICIWLAIKVARVVFKLIFFAISVLLIVGAVYWFFMR
ncbi:MAG TPA: hypothetical protein VN181_07070 [Thermoanaerobaculia bacterium]|nr:hypothetical protein [Thermoanaerobaculia bacterium]